MADIPIGIAPEGPEQIPIIPGGPGQSPPRPVPLIGTPPPPTPAPPETPTPSPQEGNAGGVPELGLLSLLLLALALALIGKFFTDFLNWMLRTALGPFSGRRGVKQLDPTKVTQALSNAAGSAVVGIDGQMGTEFTKLAQTTGRLSKTLIALGQMIYQLAGALSGLQHNTTGLHVSQAQIRSQVRQVQQTASQATAQIQTVEKQASAENQALHGQLSALTHHVTHVLEPELESLRGRIPKLERGATTAWDEIRKHDELLGLAAMTGTVAAGLGRLGGGWIRCEANQALGKAICKSDNGLIRKLLGGTIDVLALSDICDLSAAVVATAQTLRPGLEAFVSVENALIGCHGADEPGRIRLARVSRTQVFETVSL